jgi:hypothetical protein
MPAALPPIQTPPFLGDPPAEPPGISQPPNTSVTAGIQLRVWAPIRQRRHRNEPAFQITQRGCVKMKLRALTGTYCTYQSPK